MSVIAEDDIIDQADYDEFEGVDNRAVLEEDVEDFEEIVVSHDAELCSTWQPPVDHQFAQTHFAKVTSCEYCGKIIASVKWNQGLRCKECSFDCHFDCADSAPKNCVPKGDGSSCLQKHTFYEKHFGSVTFCNTCRKMLYGLGKQGYACAVCQCVSHSECREKAAVNCPPQKLESPLSENLRHFWVEGNLSGNCSSCKQSLSKMTILYGFRCTYCSLKVCPACFPQIQQNDCDEGVMASLKLGPGHFVTQGKESIKKWIIQVPEDRRPLMVFINKKSGGQVGQLIAQRLSRVLNPNQIVDLSQGGPMPMLKVMQKAKAPYRILACGGDGTAAWLLSALDKMMEEGATYVPPVAVLPLGTGNDLARVLGWGGGYDNGGLASICHKIMLGHEVYLDRWQLDVENVGLPDGVKRPKIMNNYFSIGVDAKIALDFHRKREANPSQFKSRGINKVIYAGLGAGAMFENLPNLSDVLRVDLDGVQLTLPKTMVGILVLNLASYTGGKNPWGSPGKSEGRATQSPCDGLFELIGISTTFHLGQIQTHLVDGERLGQGRDITFTWLGDDILPVQLDGEPWEEPKSIIRISFFRQSRMIASPSETQQWPPAQWLAPLPFTKPLSKGKRRKSSIISTETSQIASSSASSASTANASNAPNDASHGVSNSSQMEIFEFEPKKGEGAEGKTDKPGKKPSTKQKTLADETTPDQSLVADRTALRSSRASSDPSLPIDPAVEVNTEFKSQEAPAASPAVKHLVNAQQ
jgi:diacylglycerol kinase (ATP)